MKIKITYSKTSLKFLAKQDDTTVIRITTAIKALLHTPPLGDIKKLKGYENKMRLRIGSCRVIFHYHKEKECKILFIDSIGNRGNIYK
ncbi:MAG: type II toxin-antitoxin system RelE/ParE family toxin [Cardiobacteriaceae bacterium]|nr:type II toxin-antitoxin system RelE/ParE family toxin [Cardiobacteriaceae bacterium]